MDRAIPTLNKQIKKRQQQRNRGVHLDHLKKMRPITTGDQFYQPTINNSKKQQIMENRFTQIERENRILLQKITGIMSKKRAVSSQLPNKESNQKSLNVTFRKKKFQQIQIQNAKLLKRLQQKKSQYQVNKLKKQWKKKQYVIRNISNYPITIFEKNDKRKANAQYQKLNYTTVNKNQKNTQNWQMSKYKLIDGHTFSVTIRLDQQKLIIIAQQQNGGKQAKVIEIQKEQALDFIAQQCQGKIQKLFERLKYDGQTLYLVGDDAQEMIKNNKQGQINQNIQAHEQQEQDQKEYEQQDKKQKQIVNNNKNRIKDQNYQQQYEGQNFGELIEEDRVNDKK